MALFYIGLLQPMLVTWGFIPKTAIYQCAFFCLKTIYRVLCDFLLQVTLGNQQQQTNTVHYPTGIKLSSA